jgi:hypothetical protein
MQDLPPTAFIIKSGEAYLCPACGYGGTFQGNHYDDDEGGCIATGICACCFFEPGFSDNQAASANAESNILASVRAHRVRWIAAGSPWRGGNVRSPPAAWIAEEQLAALFRAAPFLR